MRLVSFGMRRLGAAVLAASHVLWAAGLARAEPAFPSGTSIGLEPPAGMTPSKSFSGFEHRSGASILIVEMPPEAYGQVAEKFTPEALKPTGFAVAGPAQALSTPGGEGLVLRGSQRSNGLAYAKWVAIVANPAGTALVTVQVPEAGRARVPDASVEAALRTIAFRSPRAMADQLAALPYAIGDLAGFRPVRVIAGSSLLLTDGPKDVDPDASQPMVIVAPSLGAVAAGADQAAFARKALTGLAQVKGIAIAEEASETRGDTVVVRHRGTAMDAKSGRPLAVTQTIRFTGNRYLRIIGLAPAEAAEAVDRADRIAASVAMR